MTNLFEHNTVINTNIKWTQRNPITNTFDTVITLYTQFSIQKVVFFL